MNDTPDYKLANLQRRELALLETRKTILKQEGQKALESILDAPAPATLIQSFSNQDLYYLMHKIGPSDFIPVLSMAASGQWEYILDLDVWDNDRIDCRHMTRVLDILFQADPQRLMRWLVKEKPDFIEYYYFRQMEIRIREHDALPPEDHEDFITFDDQFYFRFLKTPKGEDPEGETGLSADDRAPELIETMLKTVAAMDLSVFQGLLLESASILPAETEEEQFRLKNARLAEQGFLPAHEAIGIYQPVRSDRLKPRQGALLYKTDPFDPDMALPPQYHAQYIRGETLFEQSFSQVREHLRLDLDSELAALINKVISADKIKIRKKEDLEQAVWKTLRFLSCGLEVLIGPAQPTTPFTGAAVLEKYFLADIFRAGSSRSIELRTRMMQWHAGSFIRSRTLPLSFLDEQWLGVAGGLLLDRPLFFDNFRTGSEMYRPFETLGEIEDTRRTVDEIIAVDTVLKQIDPDTGAADLRIITWKTLMLTLWAKNRIGLEPDLSAIETAVFRPFFKQMFEAANRQIREDDFLLWISERTGVDVPDAFLRTARNLFAELEDEYGQVETGRIDPRFIVHFLLQ